MKSVAGAPCRCRWDRGSHCDEDDGKVGREGDEAVEEQAALQRGGNVAVHPGPATYCEKIRMAPGGGGGLLLN